MLNRTLVSQWPVSRLSRHVKFHNGKDHKLVENPEGLYPVYGSGGVFAYADDYLCDGEGVLFGRKGTIDKPVYVNGKFWNVDTMYFVEPDQNVLLPKYLYYWATQFPFDYYSTNTALPSMTQADIGSEPIALPPLSVQKRIVDELDRELAEIDDLIENFKSLHKILFERHASVLEGVLYKELSDVPKQKLSWHVEFLNGDRGTSYPSRDEFVQVGIPFVNAGHIAGNTIDFSEMNYVSEEKYQTMGGAKLRNDDVLYCLRGSVGKCGIYPQDHGALASSLVALRAKGKLLPKFLLLLLSSRSIKLHIDTLLTGSAQPNLSVEQLASIKIPVPDISKQISILKSYEEKKSSFESLINTVDVPWLLSERKESLINSLLSGERDG